MTHLIPFRPPFIDAPRNQARRTLLVRIGPHWFLSPGVVATELLVFRRWRERTHERVEDVRVWGVRYARAMVMQASCEKRNSVATPLETFKLRTFV